MHKVQSTHSRGRARTFGSFCIIMYICMYVQTNEIRWLGAYLKYRVRRKGRGWAKKKPRKRSKMSGVICCMYWIFLTDGGAKTLDIKR